MSVMGCLFFGTSVTVCPRCGAWCLVPGKGFDPARPLSWPAAVGHLETLRAQNCHRSKARTVAMGGTWGFEDPAGAVAIFMH